jgi:hypothetical protein
VPSATPVVTIDHVTVCAGLFVPFTVAENVIVSLCFTITVVGLTVTPVTVAGSPPGIGFDPLSHPVRTIPNTSNRLIIPVKIILFFIEASFLYIPHPLERFVLQKPAVKITVIDYQSL